MDDWEVRSACSTPSSVWASRSGSRSPRTTWPWRDRSVQRTRSSRAYQATRVAGSRETRTSSTSRGPWRSGRQREPASSWSASRTERPRSTCTLSFA